MHRSARGLAVPATVLLAGLALTSCGSDAEPGKADSPKSSTPSATAEASGEPSPSVTARTPVSDPGAVTLKLTVRGDSITPPAKVVQVERGKPVVFQIESDRPGALHVHSSPEQAQEFKKGRSTISLTLDMPGVVEVEEHEADVLVAQLQVK